MRSPRFVFHLYYQFLVLVILLLVFSFPGEGKNDRNPRKSRRNQTAAETTTCSKPVRFVLVHGYGLGAWSWYKVRSLMLASGYRVTCIDLAGAGIDMTDHINIRTFEDYDRPLVSAMSMLPDGERVIAVGFSSGGLSVTDISYRFSDKIRVGVYVAATMLRNGFMTRQDLEDGAPEFARGAAPPLPNNTREDEQLFPATFNNPGSHLNTQEDGALAGMLFRPVPLVPLVTAQFSGGDVDKVRRVYIKTSYDLTMLPHQQDAMITKWPPSEVYAVQTDHGIIGSDSFVLFGLLVKVAATLDCN